MEHFISCIFIEVHCLYTCTFLFLCVYRMLLLCRVTLGKPVEQFSATRIAHAPPGHHSVIGRPSVGGLAYPEYVIYRGEQVCSLTSLHTH